MNVQLNPIDLNTAEQVELKNVPGIGSKLADRIIAARPFSNLMDLRRVSGIGPALLEQIKPYVMLSSTPGQNIQPIYTFSETLTESSQIGMPHRTSDQIDHAPGLIYPEDQPAQESKFVENEDLAHEVKPSLEIPSEPVLNPDETGSSEPAPVSLERALTENEARELEQASLSSQPPPVSPETPIPARLEDRTVSRSELYGIAAASGVFSFILAVLFTLVFLALINGGLRFVKPSQLNQLTNQVNTIEAQSKELGGEIDALSNRLTAVEGMNGRITGLEQNTQQLRKDLDTVTNSANALNKQVDDLSSQVDTLATRTGRFQNFLDNLRNLLNNLNQ
jgi:prefoldin subunit 5